MLPPDAVNVTLPPWQKEVGPLAETFATGVGSTLTVTVPLVAEQPFTPVAVTLKLPLAVTLIEVVVAPLLQRYVLPPDAVSVTLPPLQKVSGPDALIAGVGVGLTVTVVEAEVMEQFPFTL